MVLGYNERRPKEEDYTAFVEGIKKSITTLDEGLGLMLYGSYVRGDYIPGRSDIDSVLFFPDHVVLDKNKVQRISRGLHELLRNYPIPFQVTTLDTTTGADGRFNPFTQDFQDYFRREGRILVGQDYRPEITYLQQKTDKETALSFSLRKVRNTLLFAEHDRHKHYERFLERFNETLDAVSSSIKRVLYLVDDRLRRSRFSVLDDLPTIFPDVDVGPLRQIKYLYTQPSKLDHLYEHPLKVLEMEQQAVTFLESVISAYIHEFPREQQDLELRIKPED
ncbi:MAG: nucleotidyltransferase domain-containing protein [Nanoarchaeota archaeon]